MKTLFRFIHTKNDNYLTGKSVRQETHIVLSNSRKEAIAIERLLQAKEVISVIATSTAKCPTSIQVQLENN